MDLPIKFPSDAEVIAEEVRLFRALTPAERVRSIHGIIAAGSLMMQRSPKAAFLRQHSLDQEALARRSVQEFVARHA